MVVYGMKYPLFCQTLNSRFNFHPLCFRSSSRFFSKSANCFLTLIVKIVHIGIRGVLVVLAGYQYVMKRGKKVASTGKARSRAVATAKGTRYGIVPLKIVVIGTSLDIPLTT